MSANPKYRSTNLARFKIFRKGMRVINGLYGYPMYEQDLAVDSDGITKNTKRRYHEFNKRFGGRSDS